MWMCYAEQSWDKPVDIRSSVNRLCSQLSALSFDADHSSNYNIDIIYDFDETERVRQLAKKYNEGAKVCNLYVKEEITLEVLCYEFVKLDLKHFLYHIKKYISEELQSKYLQRRAILTNRIAVNQTIC